MRLLIFVKFAAGVSAAVVSVTVVSAAGVSVTVATAVRFILLFIRLIIGAMFLNLFFYPKNEASDLNRFRQV